MLRRRLSIHAIHITTTRSLSTSSLRPVTPADAQFLQQVCQVQTVADRPEFQTDWTNRYHAPTTTLIASPKDTTEVSKVLKFCNQSRIGVVPVSGHTGLCGGSTPNGNTQILLNLRRLNDIYSLNEAGVLRTQAGVVLQDLQDYAERQNMLVPIDLGSKGSCCIGGTVATNAGGQYYYRYGSIAANVLGLQVVLPNGQVVEWNYQHPVLKDNTGYKLHQLMVGSEGTLGIITGVALLCRPLLQRSTLFLVCDSFQHVQRTTLLAKQHLGESLGALEWMDGNTMAAVSNYLDLSKRSIPVLEKNHPGSHYILVETHGSNASHDHEKLERLLEVAGDSIRDGILAQNQEQSETFWRLREASNPAVAATGCTYKYDLSIPNAAFDNFLERVRDDTADMDVDVNCWGHILDGNIHYNVTTTGRTEKDDKIQSRLDAIVLETVKTMGGSISAEHGLGQSKNHMVDECVLSRQVKQVFDPVGILNPGKFLPDVASYSCASFSCTCVSILQR